MPGNKAKPARPMRAVTICGVKIAETLISLPKSSTSPMPEPKVVKTNPPGIIQRNVAIIKVESLRPSSAAARLTTQKGIIGTSLSTNK